MLIIHAPNIHTGGGKILLLNLLASISASQQCEVIIDDRLILSDTLPAHIIYHRIQPTLFQRYKAEKLLRTLSVKARTVFCFGNLPPVFKLKSRTVLFLQSRYLVESRSKKGFSWKAKLRLWMEKKWLVTKVSNVSEIIVQTQSMSQLVKKAINRESTIMPVLDTPNLENIKKENEKTYDFIYVSSGEPHKNHKHLVEAWVLLSSMDYRPSLCVTINHAEYPELCNWINVIVEEFSLNIKNIEGVSHQEIFQLYEKSKSLLFPSYFESFGMPLIEAQRMGLPIIASEEDYVRDLVKPAETFNPHSPLSITRAVQRFMSVDTAIYNVQTSKDLIVYITK